MPITKLSLKEMKSKNRPWLTKGILKSISQKDAIYRKFIRAENLHSREIYQLEFKRHKSMINRLIRINKPKYYKTFFSGPKSNSKQTWEALRSLINFKIKSNKQTISLNINNQIETNPKTISDLTSFFPQLRKTLITKLFPLTKLIKTI